MPPEDKNKKRPAIKYQIPEEYGTDHPYWVQKYYDDKRSMPPEYLKAITVRESLLTKRLLNEARIAKANEPPKVPKPEPGPQDSTYYNPKTMKQVPAGTPGALQYKSTSATHQTLKRDVAQGKYDEKVKKDKKEKDKKDEPDYFDTLEKKKKRLEKLSDLTEQFNEEDYPEEFKAIAKEAEDIKKSIRKDTAEYKKAKAKKDPKAKFNFYSNLANSLSNALERGEKEGKDLDKIVEWFELTSGLTVKEVYDFVKQKEK